MSARGLLAHFSVLSWQSWLGTFSVYVGQPRSPLFFADSLLQAFLDRTSISLKTRARWAFGTIVTLQGAWWTWSTYIQSIYQPNNALLDWSDPGFGRGFAVRPTRPHHQNQPVEPDSAFYSCTSFSQLASS